LFLDAFAPYRFTLDMFLLDGEIRDPHNEFFLTQVHDTGGHGIDRFFCDKGDEFLPSFLRSKRKEICQIGWAIHLLGIKPPIVASTVPAPVESVVIHPPSSWRHQGFIRDVAEPADLPTRFSALCERVEANLSSSFVAPKESLARSAEHMSRFLPEHDTLPAFAVTMPFKVDKFLEAQVLSPIDERCAMIGRLSMIVLEDKFNLKSRLAVMRNYLLLYSGDFADSLASSLFSALCQVPGPSWPTSHDVSICLDEACRRSGCKDPAVERLSLVVVTAGTGVYRPHTVEALGVVRLVYRFEPAASALWAIFDETTMEKYSSIWLFLMKIKRAAFALRETWVLFKSTMARNARDNRMHMLELVQHEMDHFVRSLQQYVLTEAMDATWQRFEESTTTNATSIEAFVRCHESFLDEVLYRCLLQKKAVTLARIVDSLFNLILQYHIQARAIIESTLSQDQPEPPRSSYHWLDRAGDLAKKTYESFRELVRVLITVLSKLCYERGFQTSLAHLLSVLNFNHFYFTPDETPGPGR
jgi:hypothetical protein